MTLSQRVGGIELGKGQEGGGGPGTGVKRGRGMKDRVDRSRGIEILICLCQPTVCFFTAE